MHNHSTDKERQRWPRDQGALNNWIANISSPAGSPAARRSCSNSVAVLPYGQLMLGGVWSRATLKKAGEMAEVPWERKVELAINQTLSSSPSAWVLHMSGWSSNPTHARVVTGGNASGGTVLARIFTEVHRALRIPARGGEGGGGEGGGEGGGDGARERDER